MIKQGLTIKTGQGLSMSIQLQQAIRLLQLSSLELQQEIRENLETNPLLEVAENNESDDMQLVDEPPREAEVSADDNIPEDLPMDASWDDIYDATPWETKNTAIDADINFIETFNAVQTGLKEHLLWQVNNSHLVLRDKVIAEVIIDSINDKGYLSESLEQLLLTLNQQKTADITLFQMQETELVLHYIQHLDPLGVGARNLQECLLIQLNRKHSEHPLKDKLQTLLEKKLDLLSKRDYKVIKRQLDITTDQLALLIKLIRTFQPYPGEKFEEKQTEYIAPDVYIHKIDNDQWVASLSATASSELQINQYYKNMIPQTANKQDARYLKQHLGQAKWFIKALQTRSNTILKVADSIIKHQTAFLKFGPQAMKPMLLKDIAQDIEVHDSTVSRVSQKKYIHTPHGIFEFKYFFSSHVSTNTGGECSSTAIRAMIQTLVKDENGQKPLSDNKLVQLLAEQGIKIARRTVAKYREGLAIPSSRDRKCLV
jgi:RNA polymerase sigma-54 factor